MQHPFIASGGIKLKTHQLGKYRAVLVKDPNSVGPIKYRYVMVVFRDGTDEPVIFVTAEQNAMQAELFKIARESLNDPSLEHDPNNFFLGVFDEHGRHNLGGSPKWGQLEDFEQKALHIIRSKLGIEDPPAAPTSAMVSNKTVEIQSDRPAYAVNETSLLHQLGAVLISLVIFVLASVVAGFLLMVLDQVRGLGSDWLQSAFRDVFAPWVGGYFGVAAGLNWLQRSTAKFVFFGFTSTVLVLIGVYLGTVGLVRTEADISTASYLWGAVSLAAAIFGAYKAAHDEGLKF